MPDGDNRDRRAASPARRDRCRADSRSRTSGRCRDETHRPRSRSRAAAWSVAVDRRDRRTSGRAQGFPPDRRQAAQCRIRRPNRSRQDVPPPPAEAADRFRQRAAAAPAAMVEHEEVIAVLVETVDIAPPAQHFRQRPRAQRFVKYPVAQRLRRIDVRSRLRQPDLQRARPDVDDAAWSMCRRGFDRKSPTRSAERAARPQWR